MLYTALILGLVSSLHCIGMCGPIALMMPHTGRTPVQKALQIMVYQAGRIAAYGSIGLLFGLLGRSFHFAGIQQPLSIVAGTAMILIALVPERVLARYNFSQPIYRVISKLKSALGRQLKKQSLTSRFTLGLLNGFLPCGMVYAALFGALAQPQVTFGILYMVLFGLGTVPLMAGIHYLEAFLTAPFRSRLRKVVPYAIVVVGALFILRGLSLDIPYISPSATNLFVMATPNCH